MIYGLERLTDQEFFICDAVTLAQKLIGKYIQTEYGGPVMITETEAYMPFDTACHAFSGKTKRNAPMYEVGGTCYVYLCYGLHNLFNISAGTAGESMAVLIRATSTSTGPGILTKSLGIDRTFNNENVVTSKRVAIFSDRKTYDTTASFRVGIGYADKTDRERLWNFKLKK